MANVDTIYALATGRGQSAIAVIRVSGSAVQDVLRLMVARPIKPRWFGPFDIRHPATGRTLDRGVVTWAPGPKTYTGEDYLEFQVHGGLAVTTAILDALGSVSGCRVAEPGEFSRRAFLNGKMDLASLEGLGDLIRARTEDQRVQSIATASGYLTRHIAAWRNSLLQALALAEAEIDFPDEGDVPIGMGPRIAEFVQELKSAFGAALADGKRAEVIRDGFVVALMGAPNAGKSSLLTALAGREAAIVTEFPGTTRDPIEVRLDVLGQELVFVDTAGIRETTDLVEQLGVDRSWSVGKSADLILWLDESGDFSPSAEIVEKGGRVVFVQTKVDLSPSETPGIDSVLVSSLTGTGLNELLALVSDEARRFSVGDEPPLLTRQRHREAVQRARSYLQNVDFALDIEFVAEYLRLAIRELECIVGMIGVEDVLGEIFSRFCIGK